MAARIHKIHHQLEVREKIRASQLVNYLQKHALENQGADNATTRVRAASTLLNKVLSDLSTHEHHGPGGGDMKLTVTHRWK